MNVPKIYFELASIISLGLGKLVFFFFFFFNSFIYFVDRKVSLGLHAMDLCIWQWVMRLFNKIKLGHGQKSWKNFDLEGRGSLQRIPFQQQACIEVTEISMETVTFVFHPSERGT